MRKLALILVLALFITACGEGNDAQRDAYCEGWETGANNGFLISGEQPAECGATLRPDFQVSDTTDVARCEGEIRGFVVTVTPKFGEPPPGWYLVNVAECLNRVATEGSNAVQGL